MAKRLEAGEVEAREGEDLEEEEEEEVETRGRSSRSSILEQSSLMMSYLTV